MRPARTMVAQVREGMSQRSRAAESQRGRSRFSGSTKVGSVSSTENVEEERGETEAGLAL